MKKYLTLMLVFTLMLCVGLGCGESDSPADKLDKAGKDAGAAADAADDVKDAGAATDAGDDAKDAVGDAMK